MMTAAILLTAALWLPLIRNNRQLTEILIFLYILIERSSAASFRNRPLATTQLGGFLQIIDNAHAACCAAVAPPAN